MDRKHQKFLQDNSGATIIIVVLCIAFVSILGSVLLSATATNLQMKKIDQRSKHNFYETESAFDEIKTGLEELVASALEEAYIRVMENYITYSKEQKKQLFSKTFIDEMAEQLGGSSDAFFYNTSELSNFIKQSPAQLKVAEGKNLLLKDTFDPSMPQFITLKNVTVSYTDHNNYKTSISSDIVINTPNLDFDDIKMTERVHFPVFPDYSLISDQGISLDAAMNVKVEGNLYAGVDGIYLNHGSSLYLSGGRDIITRGDIQVAERSMLKISDYPSIWAKNMATLKGSNTASPTIIDIEGKCYIADDLMLNAKYSDVTIRGEYYGYSYRAAKGGLSEDELQSAENSSAVIINGSNSKLNLEGTDTLLISGRAYLDPTSRGNESGLDQGKVFTGESLAVKGNQYAYLVPSEYLWSGSNPVTAAEYSSKPAGVAEVDYSKLPADASLDLRDYVDGYSKIFYQSGTQNLIYYYLKFKSEEKANEYLQDYYALMNPEGAIGIIDNRIKSYASSIKVKSPLNSILSSGNVFTFLSDTGKSSLIPNSINPDPNPDGSSNSVLQAMEELTFDLATRYDHIKQHLKDGKTGAAYHPDSVFQSLVNVENIDWDSRHDSQFVSGVKRVTVGTDYVVYIVNNTGKAAFDIPDEEGLPNRGRKGMVIATGSVRVSGRYTGLILSGDQIILNSGAEIEASAALIEALLNIGNPNVNRYLRGYEDRIDDGDKEEEPSGSSKVILSNLVVYDNWEKNEY